MKSFACYCQRCRAANAPGEELCLRCGTPLMLIVTPPANKNETIWSDAFPPEHLLERISLLELRLMQVTNRLGQVLDLILRQSNTFQNEQVLFETLFEALESSGVIDKAKFNEFRRDKLQNEKARLSTAIIHERLQKRILSSAVTENLDLFTRLIADGLRLIEKSDAKQGVRMLERAVLLDAGNFPLLAFIGEHFFRADKRILAAAYLEKAHAANVSDYKTAVMLAMILTDEGELARAAAILTSLKLIDDTKDFNAFAANYILGMIDAFERRLPEALTAFKNALAIYPCAEIHYLIGSIYAETEKRRTALKHFRKAVETDENFADAWYMIGAVCLNLDDEKSAKEALGKALEARDAGAQCHAILRNPKKHQSISPAVLLFVRFTESRKNILSGSPPRFAKLLREKVENLLSAN